MKHSVLHQIFSGKPYEERREPGGQALEAGDKYGGTGAGQSLFDLLRQPLGPSNIPLTYMSMCFLF